MFLPVATADPRLILLTILEEISGPSASQWVTTFSQPTELIRSGKTTKLREVPDKSIWKLTITPEFQKTCFGLPCDEK